MLGVKLLATGLVNRLLALMEPLDLRHQGKLPPVSVVTVDGRFYSLEVIVEPETESLAGKPLLTFHVKLEEI